MHFSLQMAGAEMTVSMLLLLLLLTVVTQAAAEELTVSTLTTDQLHKVLCAWTVAHRHFTPGRPLVVSLPGSTPHVARSALSEPLRQRDDLLTVKVLLRTLHEGKWWPIELFLQSRDGTADSSVLQHSYICFNFCKKLKKIRNFSIQPRLRGSNDLGFGRKIASFQYFTV